jgi:penicillin-insensitive murein DD-endopeptidase
LPSRDALIVLAMLLAPAAALAAESICHGTTGNGRLENGVKLPLSGANFSSYSTLGASLGRTHVHSRVHGIVVAAYQALEKMSPGTAFVYGETGWPGGGQMRPHRTHQNGLSVDFFVPVRDKVGRSVPLPTAVTERFGYDIEFDATGRHGDYTIDFEALAEHLVQLHVAARANGAGIALVILDPPYLPKLFATRRGPYLQQHLPFMKTAAWVRHDEHYHVDFSVPCKPLNR